MRACMRVYLCIYNILLFEQELIEDRTSLTHQGLIIIIIIKVNERETSATLF